MASAIRLKAYLETNGVPYDVLPHRPAFTAQTEAAATHVPGREWAKTVVLRVDGRFALAVLPAHHVVDLDALAKALGSPVRICHEHEFAGMFPGCELGAMPPFGNLYGLDTWVAEPLTRDRYIAFPAGSHSEAVRVAYADFARLARPRIARFSRVRPLPEAEAYASR